MKGRKKGKILKGRKEGRKKGYLKGRILKGRKEGRKD